MIDVVWLTTRILQIKVIVNLQCSNVIIYVTSFVIIVGYKGCNYSLYPLKDLMDFDEKQ